MTQSHAKRKASTSVPVMSEPPAGKQASQMQSSSHILYSMPIVLDDYQRTDIPPLHDPNHILGDMTRHMSGLSLTSMDSSADEFYRHSYTSDRSLCAPDSTRSALISERSSTTAVNSDRSSMPTSDFMGDDVLPTPRPVLAIPKEERPVQPEEERDFYEKLWMINFQQSTAQTPVVPESVYIPPGEQGQLVRISGHSLASGASGKTGSQKGSSSRPYVVFRLEVECQANTKRWTVYRRYHDFKQLAGQLKGQGFRIPSLPSRQLSIRRSFDMAFLRKRQSDLEAWLKLVLSIPSIPNTQLSNSAPSMSQFIRVFLTREANQPPALETGTRGFSYNEPEVKTTVFSSAAMQLTPPQPSHSRTHSHAALNLMSRTNGDGHISGNSKSRLSALFLHQTEPTKHKRSGVGRSTGRSTSNFESILSKSSSSAMSRSTSSVLTTPSVGLTRELEPYQSTPKPSSQDFEPLRFIGQGSFGRVLLVRKKHQNELFAMKILSKQSVVQKEQVEHTKTERNVLGSIDHPFIVRLHYAFQTAKQLYFILDYCPGGDLFFHLSRVGCFPESIAKFYVAEITLALVHLHEHGIVYRDLKPENIMLDVDGHVKLADFGLAKQGISNRSQGTNTLCGTPEYLPPEILNKKGHGNAVDWWNLGMVLYELLTGRPPWYTTDREEMYRRLRSSPLEFPPGMSPESMDLIAGLLERDPTQRLRAAQVLAHPFFYGIQWDLLLHREIEPAFRPCQFSDPLDAVNFEDDFTRMPVLMALDDFDQSKPKVSENEMVSTPKSSVAGRANTSRNLSYTFQGFTFDGEMELDQALLTTPSLMAILPALLSAVKTVSLRSAIWSQRNISVRFIASNTYDWIKDPSSPKLRSFIESEHKRWKKESKPYRSFQRKVYMEMRDRLKLEKVDHSIPEQVGEYFYYLKTIPRLNFPIYCRQHITTSKEEILLNPNEMDFGQIGVFKVSTDGRFLAYTMDISGDEVYTAYIKDLQTLRTTKIQQPVRSIEWDQVGSLYYTVPDQYHRPNRVYRHRKGSPDALIYEELDPSVYLDVVLTKDMKYVLINANSKRSSEVHSLDAMDSSASPHALRKRDENVLYFADHAQDAFYIVTNADNASNYKVVRMDDSNRGTWTQVLADTQDVKIDEMDLFHNHLVLYERHAGLPRIRIVPLDAKNAHEASHILPLPQEYSVCSLHPAANRHYEGVSVRFTLSTPLVPEIVYDYNMATGQLQVLKEERTPSFDPTNYTCYQLHVQHDNVSIPMTLVHHKDIKLDGMNPTLLVGYGAYGMNLETSYDMESLSLLERRWILAFAHVRGGGELGLSWHTQGKSLQKKNSFHDFVACATYLQENGFTCAQRMAAKGTSAGGLIMGYIANDYKALCRALIMNVPFLDIASTMQDPSLPLTIHEYDEWGNPTNDVAVREYIESYSPIGNIRTNGSYPAMLVTTALNDMRVNYWEPLSWVRQLGKRSSTLWCKVSDDGGHFNGLGRLDQIQAAADEIVFLYHALELNEKKYER